MPFCAYIHSLIAREPIFNDAEGTIVLCRVCLYLGEPCAIPMGTLGLIYNVKDPGQV